MDVAWFFHERMRFIRFYYETAARPFAAMIEAIEEESPPYDDPPYSEDGELPFMTEWGDADDALVVLGRSCVSMLSASLRLYFDTWDSKLRVTWEQNERKKAWKKGFAEGYLAELCGVLNINLADCPADLAVIEQVFLARNRDQHPHGIHTMRVNHSQSDRAKHPSPFFAVEGWGAISGDPDLAGLAWLTPSIHVDNNLLNRAIAESEALVDWLEPQFLALRHPGRPASKE